MNRIAGYWIISRRYSSLLWSSFAQFYSVWKWETGFPVLSTPAWFLHVEWGSSGGERNWTNGNSAKILPASAERLQLIDNFTSCL